MITSKGKGNKRLHIGNRFLIVLILTIVGLALALPSFAFADDVWQNIGPANEEVKSLHISPNYAHDYTLFAGTTTKGVYRTTNKGHDWVQVNTGLTSLNIRSVAVSENFATDNTVFAATGAGVFKSTNKGDSWVAANTGLTTTDVHPLAVSPAYATDHTVFVGTASSGIFKSTDGGGTWSPANTGLANTDVRTIAMSPNFGVDRTMFAGTYGGGVFKSTDGGTTWQAANNCLTSALITDIALSLDFPTDHVVLVGTYGGGVFQSTTAGSYWIEANVGIPSTDRYVLAVAISPGYTRSKDGTCFAGTTNGVYKSTTQGAQWSQINNGLMHKLIPSIDPTPCYCLDKTVYAGSGGGGVYSCIFSASGPAPTTGMSISNPAYPDGDNSWFKTAPTITLASSAPGTTYYQWDSSSGAWTTYTSAFTALEGHHTLYYYSVDTTGNAEAYKSNSFDVDTILPTNPSVTSPSHTTGSTSPDNTIDISFSGATDGGSGINGYSVEWSQSPTTVPDTTVDMTGTAVTLTSSQLADGSWYFHLSTKDIAGNQTSAVHLGPFIIDAAAPTTTWSSVPPYTSGWFNTIPSITLARSEPGTTYYQWDSTSTAGWQTYSNSITASEGQHTLYFYSKDTAGNTEAVNAQTFKVDTLSPTAFTLASPANNSSTNNITNPTFAWNASSDSGSGMAKYQLYIDGAMKQETSATSLAYTLTSPLTAGTHTWYVKALDMGGNSTTSTATFTLNVGDALAPNTTLSSSPSYSGGWVKTSPGITLTRDESGTTYYQWDSTSTAGWQTYSNSITASEGQHTLYYYSKDLSNNAEPVKSQPYSVDSSAPSAFNLSAPADNSSTNNAATPTFTWAASSDSGSGMAKYQLYIHSSLTQIDIPASQTSYTLSSPLEAGTHTWYVIAVDGAGNATTSTATNTLNVADVVPPVTSMSTNPSYTSGWFKTSPSITLTRNEPGTTYYQWDSTSTTGWQTYTGSITAQEGQHTLYYYSADTFNNTEANKSQTFKVDLTPPSAFDISSPTDGSSTDNKSLPTFTWVASSDSGSGVAKYQLYIDNTVKQSNISPSQTSYTLTSSLAAGTHTWYIQAMDAAGNVTNSTSTFSLNVQDIIAPVTTISTNPSYTNGSNGWFKTAPVVTLTRNEVGTTSYQLDLSGLVTYTGSFAIPEGQHTLTYSSVDTSNNTETNKTQSFKIDAVAPSAFDISSPADGSSTDNASLPTFTWAASSDSGSGMAKYQFYVDGVLSRDSISPSSTSYTVSTPLTPGSHTWYIQAVDSAGNTVKSTSTFTITVSDVVPPVTTIALSPSYTDGLNGWYKSTPSITLTRNEPGTTYYQWDSTSGAWTSFSESIATFAASEGQHTLYYYSEDTVANKETIKSKAFKIDITAPPAFDISSPANNSSTNNASYPTLSWGASSDINLAKYQLYIDGALSRDSLSPSSTSYTVSTPLIAGTHTWYIQAVDSAGNTTKSTSTFTINVADVVPPATALSTNPSSPDGSGGWFVTAPVITLTRNEPGATYYQWDSTSPSGWQTYATGGITGPEGKHTLYYYSDDTSANTETVKSKAFNVDLSAPAAFNIGSPADNSSTNNVTKPTFTWTASSDSVSGVAKYQLYVDGSLNRDYLSASSTSYTMTTPLDAGAHTWNVKAVDVAGNAVSSTATFTLNVSDVTPPVTTLSTNPSGPDGSNGWFKAKPSILLTRNEPGTTYYQVDSTSTGGWTVYTSATAGVGAQEGQHTVYFYSTDSYNNTETIRSQLIKIDTAAPSSGITSPVNGAHLNGTSCTISGTASDTASSGLSKIEISINDGVWVTASGTTAWSYSWPLPADGSYTIKSRATDIAGNVETVGSGISVLVDKAAPSVVSNGPADGATNVSIATNITAVFSEDIDPATINGTTFTLKDNNNNPITGTVTYDPASRTATFRPSSPLNYSTTYTATISTGVKDLAGTGLAANKSWSFATMLLTSSPVTSLYVDPASPNGTNGWYNTKPTITLTSDRIGTTYYQWDSPNNWQVYPGSLTGNLIPEGQHTLYYCSASSGITETANSQAFKIDATPPSIPANVKAMPVCPCTIQLSWDVSTDNVATTGYNVYNGSKQKIASTTGNSFSIGGLQPSTSYGFYVKAYDAASNMSDYSSVATTSTLPSQPTGSGSGVTVNLPGVQLEFSNVTKDGTTTASIDTNAPYNEPANFKFRGAYIDVQTTASYTGDITITVSYDPSQVTGNPHNLKLMHWNGQRWENITVSVDTVNHTITGVTKSLSPFGVGEDLLTGIGSGSGIAFGMNTDLLLVLSLTLMISGAWLMLRRRSTI